LKTAILITYNKEDSIREAVALCEAADYKPVHTVEQKYLNRPKFGISEEIVNRLDASIKRLKPDVVVYDEILKPSQNYNLASKLKINILDREALILEIFQSRAKSSESQLQVKLAQLRYEMSKAKEKVRLAKMGEQPGFMGIGKFEVDVYYNDIKHRMNTIKSKLAKAGKQRELHRQSRHRLGFKTISLAGYTSAGKTTLFNYLTGEAQQEGKELFTTLSTTTRKIAIKNKEVLISDTVGFISKLPAYMIEAFKSTLEELIYTDVVIVVIDVSDPDFDLKKKFQSCISTLNGLGVERDRIIFALNKSDLLMPDEIEQKARQLKLEDDRKSIPISAITGQNMTQLKNLIAKLLETPKPVVEKKKVEFGAIYEN
jgi:GTP-binding protein HflX